MAVKPSRRSPTDQFHGAKSRLKGQNQYLLRETHKVDFGLHSFAGSSAVSAENTSMSAGTHVPACSNRFGATLITTGEILSIHNYVET